MMQLPDAPTLRQRAAIYMGMQSSDEYREAVIDKCRESTIFFINMFGWTYDPRPEMDGPHIPFMLYPFQVDTVLWIEKRLSSLEDGVIEKSRDMGLTWIIVAIAVKKWLFEDGFQALFGSRKEDFVDNGLMDSIFK